MNAVGGIKNKKYIKSDYAQFSQLYAKTMPSHPINTIYKLEMPSVKPYKKVRTKLHNCLGKYTEIERENRILLEKMSNIMQDNRPKLYNPSKAPTAKSD